MCLGHVSNFALAMIKVATSLRVNEGPNYKCMPIIPEESRKTIVPRNETRLQQLIIQFMGG